MSQVQSLVKQLQDAPEEKTKVLAELRALAGDSDTRVQVAAAKAMATVGEYSEESLELLLGGLSRSIGGNSFSVPLNKLGKPAIPGVLDALKSEEATTRKNAAFCLGLTWCTAQAEKKISALSNAAEQDPDPSVRHQAAVAIAILSRQDDVDPKLKELVVPTLKKSLQNASTTPENRRHLASVVGGMGHKAHPLIPAMITLLKDQDAKIRGIAANAIGLLASPYPMKRGKIVRTGDQPNYRASSESTDIAVQALIAVLSDTDPKVRAEAARGLSYIGRNATKAISALKQQLQDEETEVRLRAAESLVRITPDASAAIPILEAAVADESDKTINRWWKPRAQGLLNEIGISPADGESHE